MAILSTASATTIGVKQPIIYRLYELSSFDAEETYYNNTSVQNFNINFREKGVNGFSRISGFNATGGFTSAYVYSLLDDNTLNIDGGLGSGNWSNGNPVNPSTATIWLHFAHSTNSTNYTNNTIEDINTNFVNAKVRVGHRVSANVVEIITGNPLATPPIPDAEVYFLSFAFVTAVETNKLTIDEWSNGIPTNGQIANVDGFGVVLPFPQSIQETFEPDIVTHELLKDRSEVSKMYGYNYSCEIGYDDYLPQDTLINLKEILKYKITGSTEKIIIVPRKDRSGFNYEVYLDGDLSFTPLYYSKLGAKGISFSLKGTQNVAVPSFVGVGGYGTGYGLDYGNQF